MAAPAMAVSLGGEVEEALQRVDVEDLGRQPPAEHGVGDADQAGDDEACCLLPGISRLAMRPANRPRTIQAMMPMTDSVSQ
jgi:hypothetical protein